VGVPQLLYLAGKWLKRKGIRYTTLATIIAGGAIAADIALGSTVNLGKLNVALIPGIIAVLTFGLGNTLIGISNLFSSERLLVADANSMNLMEDRKKAEMERHLEVLWDRVFKYESRLHNGPGDNGEARRIKDNRRKLGDLIRAWPAEVKDYFGIGNGCFDEFVKYVEQFRPLSDGVEATKDGFITSACFGLQQSLPQKLEKALTGFDLSLVEDWYDGAFFTSNDNKLKKQYAGHKSIRGVRNEIGISLRARIREALSGHPDPLWHSLTMRKLGMSVGTQMGRMNEEYVGKRRPSYFDAQHFLWSDDRCDALIVEAFADDGQKILDDLRQSRKKMVRRIFSDHKCDGHTQVFRMFGRDFIRAMDLRLSYDVEFAAGVLDYDPVGDIHELEEMIPVAVFVLKRAEKKICKAESALKIADDFLAEYFPGLDKEPFKIRAARTVFYLNKHKIQTLAQGSPREAIDILDRHMAGDEKYSERICLLRVHYELARIQLFSYISMIDDLAEYD
jgi:hypothetical protein